MYISTGGNASTDHEYWQQQRHMPPIERLHGFLRTDFAKTSTLQVLYMKRAGGRRLMSPFVYSVDIINTGLGSFACVLVSTAANHAYALVSKDSKNQW